MRRRSFLAASAAIAGASLPRILLGQPCPPPSVGVGGDSASTSCGSQTAAADWLTRISGPGVIWYHNFDNAAEVDNFRWTNSYAGGNDPLAVGSSYASNTKWVATGGADGGGYLQLFRPAGTSGDGTYWWRPFSPLTGASNGRGTDDPGGSGTFGHLAPQVYTPSDGSSTLWDWATVPKPGWYGHASYADSTFDGTDFYIQVRVKVDPNRTTPGNIQVGKLVSYSTTRNSYTNQEVVTYSADFATGGVGVPNRHNMYEGYNYRPLKGSGYSSGTQNPKNWAYSFGWDTLLFHCTPGTNGGSDNGGTNTRLEVWAAHEGETAYTKIWDITYAAYFDGGTYFKNGWNAFLCWIYQNGLQNSAFYQKYDQIIFSKASIACPQV